MASVNSPFAAEDVLVCTQDGVRVSNDAHSSLAPGFRDVLRAINGKRTVADLKAFLPQLDPLKVAIWLDDARRMELVKLAAAVEKVVAGPAAAFEYGAYIEKDDEVAALARDISKWVKQKPQSGVRARNADLSKTVQMASLQSGEALESLAISGVFTSADLQDFGASPENMFPPISIARPGATPASGDGRQMTALIADEDVPSLGALAGLLGAAGYLIRATGTRKQFIDEMNQAVPPDVIFLKLESTVLDAFKTVDKIRQHPQLGRIPVVISGVSPTREEIAKSIMLGASAWIVRPYTNEKIAAALSGALAGVG